MDVILLEKVVNVGNMGDKVSVKAGFARNYLIPQGAAKLATKANLAEFEARRAELEKLNAEKLAAANARAEELRAIAVTIPAKVGEEGKLFGSIGTRDICEAMNAAGAKIAKSEIRLPDGGAIREIGEYMIRLHIHAEVDLEVKVTIEPEKAA